MRTRVSPAAAALRDVMRNPSIKRIELSWTTGTAADWAFLVVLLVFVYDASGTLAVGILGVVRIVPAILTAPFAPTLVERYRGDRVFTVHAVRSDGSRHVSLAKSPKYDAEPSWSQDGKSILFASTRDGNRDIYVMTSTGRSQVNLTNSAVGIRNSEPAWQSR